MCSTCILLMRPLGCNGRLLCTLGPWLPLFLKGLLGLLIFLGSSILASPTHLSARSLIGFVHCNGIGVAFQGLSVIFPGSSPFFGGLSIMALATISCRWSLGACGGRMSIPFVASRLRARFFVHGIVLCRWVLIPGVPVDAASSAVVLGASFPLSGVTWRARVPLGVRQDFAV